MVQKFTYCRRKKVHGAQNNSRSGQNNGRGGQKISRGDQKFSAGVKTLALRGEIVHSLHC